MPSLRSLAAVFVPACLAVSLSMAQSLPTEQQAKLVPYDGGTLVQKFGWSVSVSGDLAVIGSSTDDDNETSSGSAYVFRRTGGTWVQEQKLHAFDPVSRDEFGYSVAISGEVAIVGGWAMYSSSAPGSALIYRRTGAVWSLDDELTPPDLPAQAEFGNSVAIEGDVAVVGAHFDDDSGSYSGSAYVFRDSGVHWDQVTKLLANDGGLWDEFGSGVAVLGHTVVVGAHGDGGGTGSVYVFEHDGSAWRCRRVSSSSMATEPRLRHVACHHRISLGISSGQVPPVAVTHWLSSDVEPSELVAVAVTTSAAWPKVNEMV